MTWRFQPKYKHHHTTLSACAWWVVRAKICTPLHDLLRFALWPLISSGAKESAYFRTIQVEPIFTMVKINISPLHCIIQTCVLRWAGNILLSCTRC